MSWLRGDIRFLPFRASARFDLVMAPYGILQSLVSDRDLDATLASVRRVLAGGGTFGIDLVPDLPVWKEYRNKLRFRGSRRGGKSQVTLMSQSDRIAQSSSRFSIKIRRAAGTASRRIDFRSCFGRSRFLR